MRVKLVITQRHIKIFGPYFHHLKFNAKEDAKVHPFNLTRASQFILWRHENHCRLVDSHRYE